MTGTNGEPKPNKAESIFERSTREAKAIIDRDKAERDVKTARLRAARLAREAKDGNGSDKPKKSKRK